MGTDIHGVLEVKEDEQWLDVGKLDTDFPIHRLYLPFSFLFGVRGDDEGIAPRRGIPDDATKAVKDEALSTYREWSKEGSPDGYDMPSYHSQTWVGWNEIAHLDFASIKPSEYYPMQTFGDDWLDLFDHMRTLATKYGADNVRLVVWFDS
jgi:hypothetical protein